MAEPAGRPPGELWTIGHWTCPPGVVLATLAPVGIDLLVDVRRVPGSRTSPQFNSDELPQWLATDGVDYLQLPELGGRRPRDLGVDSSRNAGWRNPSFRNYADYTLSPDYRAGIDRLALLAGEHRVAIMCGEPMPWRCHRLLIANTLAALGWAITHLMAGGTPQPHRLGQWGATPVVGSDGSVSYPASADSLAEPAS